MTGISCELYIMLHFSCCVGWRKERTRHGDWRRKQTYEEETPLRRIRQRIGPRQSM